jgi:regulator of RNase E activity RraA
VTAVSVVVLGSIFSPGEWVDTLKTHTVAGMVTWGPSRGVAVIRKIELPVSTTTVVVIFWS